jgi:hypothetical protein
MAQSQEPASIIGMGSPATAQAVPEENWSTTIGTKEVPKVPRPDAPPSALPPETVGTSLQARALADYLAKPGLEIDKVQDIIGPHINAELGAYGAGRTQHEQEMYEESMRNALDVEEGAHIREKYYFEDLRTHEFAGQKHWLEGETTTPLGKDWNDAFVYYPNLGNYWKKTEPFTGSNTFGQAAWNAVKRDNPAVNIYRFAEKLIASGSASKEETSKILNARIELLEGIPFDKRNYILNLPTLEIAIKESERVRHTNFMALKAANTHGGKQMMGEMAGFVMDPTTWFVGGALWKGYSVSANVARRIPALAALAARPTPLTTKMAKWALGGAFEEAVTMAPRWMADPTFETREYTTQIAWSAAFAGFMPLAFVAGKRGFGYVPEAHESMMFHLQQWGVERAVRQAAAFPGQLRQSGLREPGTAFRAAGEQASAAIDARARTVRAHSDRRRMRNAAQQDLASASNDAPNLADAQASNLDNLGDAALRRGSYQASQAVIKTVAGTLAAAIMGPGPAAMLVLAFAQKDPLAIALKAVIKAGKMSDPGTTRRKMYDVASKASDSALSRRVIEATAPLRPGAGGAEELFEDAAEFLGDFVTARAKEIAAKGKAAQDRLAELRRRSEENGVCPT